MFSILIDEPNGNQRLREDALEVRRLNQPITRDGKVVTEPGLLIRWSDGVETHFGESAKGEKPSAFYVMNRNGATVATYRL